MEKLVVGNIQFAKNTYRDLEEIVDKFNTVVLVLMGDVIVKKNNKQIFWNKRINRPFITTSSKFKHYEQDIARQITAEKKNKFNKDDKLQILIYWTPSSNRQDLDNIVTSITDLLQDNDVIPNDRMIVKINAEKVGIDKTNPRVDIGIQKV